MKNWFIYRSDGQYVGQSMAFAPKVAFCEYMALFGGPVPEEDVVSGTTDEYIHRFSYRSEEFLLTTKPIVFESVSSTPL